MHPPCQAPRCYTRLNLSVAHAQEGSRKHSLTPPGRKDLFQEGVKEGPRDGKRRWRGEETSKTVTEGQEHDLIQVAEDELVSVEEDDTLVADERPRLRLGVNLLPCLFLELRLEGCAPETSAPACRRQAQAAKTGHKWLQQQRTPAMQQPDLRRLLGLGGSRQAGSGAGGGRGAFKGGSRGRGDRRTGCRQGRRA